MEWLLNELLHLATTDFRGKEAHARKRVAHRSSEEIVRALQHLEAARFCESGRVDHELREHFAFHVRVQQDLRVLRLW